MSKRDVIDKELARRFAWRNAMPAASEEPQTASPPEAQPPPKAEGARDEESRSADARRAEERCKLLAQEIQRAWEMQSEPHQAAAARKLVRAATRMAFDIVRMEDHPLAAIRLWRLVVRHLGPGPARGRPSRTDLFGLTFMPLPTRPREIVDLLAEAAEKGDDEIVFLLEMDLKEKEMSRHQELGERLSRLVDTARSWGARVRAARWLSLAEFPAAIPALRRALRMPHLRLRHHALFVLSQMKGPALTADDVLWLLEDAVLHPMPPHVDFGRAREYEGALIEAVKLTRPEGGDRPLRVIAEGGGTYIQGERRGLDSGWALQALAAAYPERALLLIDRERWSTNLGRRRDALDALPFLSDGEARPRLLEGAADPDHFIAGEAREQWFKRFGEACPVGPLSGVPVELLSEPPSELFLSRLAVLRGKSDDARNTMTAAVLAEAPEQDAPPSSLSAAQRELLALLTFTLGAGSRTYGQAGLPASEGGWTQVLVARFGAPAFDALAKIAERQSIAGADSPWLSALAAAGRDGLLTADQKDRLRSIASAALTSPSWDGASAPLLALDLLGAPPEMLDRLWNILLACSAEDASRPRHLESPAYCVVEALATLPGSSALDARATAAAEEALVRGEEDLFKHLMRLGSARKSAQLLAVAARTVDLQDGRPQTPGMADSAAAALRYAGCVDAGWLLERLRAPESPVFGVVVDLVDKAAPPDVIEAVQGALESPARGGAAAAEAARCLLWAGVVSTEEPRLAGILERAPAMARAKLTAALIQRGAPLDGLRSHAAEALLSSDHGVAHDVLESLYSQDPEGTYELFEELLPRSPPGPARDLMERYLRAPGEAGRYWVDGHERDGDDDDEQAEEDSFEEDDDEELA